jgi:pyranose oxidase
MIPADVDRGRPWHAQITRDPLPAKARPAGVDRREVVQLRWFAPCEPRSENEIHYAQDDRDAFGMPQPIFDFSLAPDDRRIVIAMIRDCEDVAQLLGGFIPGFEGRMQPPGHALHTAGTFRIGTSVQESVCDVDLRVWGFENLYLGGNGTIPNAHSMNPTLTAAALAVRAARVLGSRFGRRRE